MATVEDIVQELDGVPEHDLDKLLSFLRSLKQDREEDKALLLASESSLAEDRLTPEEDAAWASTSRSPT